MTPTELIHSSEILFELVYKSGDADILTAFSHVIDKFPTSVMKMYTKYADDDYIITALRLWNSNAHPLLLKVIGAVVPVTIKTVLTLAFKTYKQDRPGQANLLIDSACLYDDLWKKEEDLEYGNIFNLIEFSDPNTRIKGKSFVSLRDRLTRAIKQSQVGNIYSHTQSWGTLVFLLQMGSEETIHTCLSTHGFLKKEQSFSKHELFHFIKNMPSKDIFKDAKSMSESILNLRVHLVRQGFDFARNTAVNKIVRRGPNNEAPGPWMAGTEAAYKKRQERAAKKLLKLQQN